MAKRKQYQMSLLYGTIFFFVGVLGMVFPETSRFIASFCFIFGGSSLLQALLYLGKHKNKTDIKYGEK